MNCRRAASAAFQENIGRQGALCFPHGLEIMALADYHSLGNRKVSYIDIAYKIASYDIELYTAFQYHLRYYKLIHWDINIRILASKSLACLTQLYRSKTIHLLDELINDSVTINRSVEIRHGCLLGVAELLYALYITYATATPKPTINTLVHTNTNNNNNDITYNTNDNINSNGTTNTTHISNNTNCIICPSDELIDRAISIIPTLQTQRLYRGKNTAYLRIVSCYVIQTLDCCKLLPQNSPQSSKTQILLLDFLNENLRQPYNKIQISAKFALRQLLFIYYGININSIPSKVLVNKTYETYIHGIVYEENVAVTRGYAQALSKWYI